ncbi:MAG: hypothetical protein ACTSWY_00695 [Promethearchaeota archaeon]
MIDYCSHGFLRSECPYCQINIPKTPVSLLKEPLNWEIEVPYAHLDLDFKDTLSTRIKPVHRLERQEILSRPSVLSSGIFSEKKSLFEQREELMAKKIPGQRELDKSAKIVDIRKRFLKE